MQRTARFTRPCACGARQSRRRGKTKRHPRATVTGQRNDAHARQSHAHGRGGIGARAATSTRIRAAKVATVAGSRAARGSRRRALRVISATARSCRSRKKLRVAHQYPYAKKSHKSPTRRFAGAASRRRELGAPRLGHIRVPSPHASFIARRGCPRARARSSVQNAEER